MAEEIHVVLAADANYAPGLEVTRKSMLGNCSRPERLRFRDKSSPVYPPHYQLWWNGSRLRADSLR